MYQGHRKQLFSGQLSIVSKVIHVSTIYPYMLYSHAKANALLYFVVALLEYIDIFKPRMHCTFCSTWFLKIHIMEDITMFVCVCVCVCVCMRM